MQVDFDALDRDLTEVEMALFTAIQVTMKAALLAGANAPLMVQHFHHYEANFANAQMPKAQQIMAALELLTKRAAGIR